MRPWYFGDSAIPFSFIIRNLLPLLIVCCVSSLFLHQYDRRGDWGGGFSLETYLRWVGSPSTALHARSTPRRELMTERWSPQSLRSPLGSKSRRHHRSSQRYKRKARAGEGFEALGGRDSRAHPVQWQKGSKHTGSSSDICGFEDQEWVQGTQLLSKSSRNLATWQ